MIGNEVNINLEIMKFKSLKSVYCDVESRIKYREKILHGEKYVNMILVRC